MSENPLDAAAVDKDVFEDTARSVLAKLSLHHEATRVHSVSVAAWSRKIAIVIGCSAADVRFIERSALLHDIGKLRTPRHILEKPGPLTADEWPQMRQHALDGGDVLRAEPALAAYADVVAAHHERYDGLGYPYGLAGDDIPLAARIIAVADSLDAMVRDRSYRAAMPPTAALAELQRCRGSQFDGSIVDALLAITRIRQSHDDSSSSRSFG